MKRYVYKLAPVGVILLMMVISIVIVTPLVLAAPIYSITEVIALWVILLPVLYAMACVLGPLLILSLEMASNEVS